MNPRPSSRRRTAGVLLALAALALALRAAGLGTQVLIGDDVSVAKTARNFVAYGWPEPTMWNHPRLRDLLVSASLDLLGDGPWGIKLWSVLLGTLSVPATALLVLALTSSLPAAAVAGLVVATDPLHLDFSRQAINDVHLAFFAPAAILALLRYRERLRPEWLTCAGLLLGLGIASKWSAGFPAAVAAAVVSVGALRAASTSPLRAAELALFAACLVLLPLATYVLTYAPWFDRGHDLRELVAFHRAMAYETSTHTGYPGTKLPGFPGEVVGAWRWFVQPIWYVDPVRLDGSASDGPSMAFLVGVANPLAWLATLPAAGLAAWRWARQRDRAAAWLLVLFLASYLPFVLVPRPIWTNSALAVLPFSAALVGWAAARLRERSRLAFRAWAASALALAALLSPAAAGVSTDVTDRVVRALVSPLALDAPPHPTIPSSP